MKTFRVITTAKTAALTALSLAAVATAAAAAGPITTPAFVARAASRKGVSDTFANRGRQQRQRPGSDATKLRYISLEQVSDFYQNFPLQSAVLTCGVKASVADTIAQVKPQIEENKNKNQKQTKNDPQEELQHHRSFVQSMKPSIDSGHETPKDESNTVHQSVLDGTSLVRDIDWEARRNLAYVLYGGIFVGAMSHVEYSCVFPFLFGTEKTALITTEKVIFDNLLVAPTVWLPPAYWIKAWVYGGGGDDETDDGPGRILADGLNKYLVDVRDHHLLWKYWAIWFPAQSVSFSVVPDHLRVAFMASISFFWFILFSTVSSQGDGDTTDVTE